MSQNPGGEVSSLSPVVDTPMIGTIRIFSFFANSVGTAGPIGMGEALCVCVFDVFRSRGDDGVH